LHYQLIGSNVGFLLLSKSVTLNDLDLEQHYRRFAVFFLRKRQVSELTTPNWLNIHDNFSMQKCRAKNLVSDGV